MMQYWIWLRDKKTGEAYIYEDSYLPGTVPSRVVDLIVDYRVAAEMDLCKACVWSGNITHVIEKGTGRKFCPVLFAELFKPPWSCTEIF